jgi:hypothetical protein
MKNKSWILILVALVVSGAALAADVATSESKYQSVIKKYIKRNQVFSFETFQADIIWGILYVTPQSREALWARESWITEKSAEIHSVILPASKVRGTQFVLGMYAPRGAETFDLTPETFWTLKLEQNGQDYTPVAIEPLPSNFLVKRLIPFTHKWAKLYLVTFAGDFEKPFTLRMVGALAKGVIDVK